jgi:hypothetical protein
MIAKLFRELYTQDERLTLISEAIERWPESSELYYLKARITLQSDLSEEADQLLARCLSLGLSHPALIYEALRSRAALAFKRKHYQDSHKAYTILAQREDLLIEEGERQELELWARRALFFNQSRSSR